MGKISNQDFLDGVHAVVETLSALKLAVERGQVLTQLQKIEVLTTLDLIDRQVEELKKVFK